MSKFLATIRTDDKTRALQSAMLSVLEEKLLLDSDKFFWLVFTVWIIFSEKTLLLSFKGRNVLKRN